MPSLDTFSVISFLRFRQRPDRACRAKSRIACTDCSQSSSACNIRPVQELPLIDGAADIVIQGLWNGRWNISMPMANRAFLACSARMIWSWTVWLLNGHDTRRRTRSSCGSAFNDVRKLPEQGKVDGRLVPPGVP